MSQSDLIYIHKPTAVSKKPALTAGFFIFRHTDDYNSPAAYFLAISAIGIALIRSACPAAPKAI